MSIGTSTSVDPLALGTSVSVTFASNGTCCAIWYDGTNVKASYASSPYTSWTALTVSAAGGVVASARLDTSDTVNVILYVSGGLSYVPITLSGASYSVGSLTSIATISTGGNNLMGCLIDKDPQSRYWAVATDRIGSNINAYETTTPTTAGWTNNHTVAWSSDVENNFPAGGIVGNYFLILYPTATSTFNYQRVDVHSASIGSWSSATAFTPGGSSVTYDSYFAFRGNSTAGVEANSSGSGIWARVYNPGSDTWASAVHLSSGASDTRPTVIGGSDGNFYVIWMSFVASNNYALLYKKYTVGTSTWDTSATTLVASGANNTNPIGGSNNNKIGVLYQTGTASPYTVNFTSISLGAVVDHSWQMRGRVAILTDHAWQMRTRVSTVVDHDWNMRGNVSITTDHSWQVRGRVSALTDHAWQMRARVSTTADHRWQLRGNVGNTIDHAWQMRARLSGVADHRWQLRGNVAILTDHHWQLRGNVGATADHHWSMRGRISSSTDHVWQMRGRVGALTDHLWSVRGRIGNVGTHHWPIRGGIGTTVPHRWQMRARLANNGSHHWQMRGNIGLHLASGGYTLWANGSGTASFDSFRVVAYPDPSTSLASAGRAANSVANWNAVQPTNTALTVTTSTDNGVTYQAVAAAGNEIPGISTLLYSALISQQKPSGYYHLGESSGTSASDASGNGYTGTYTGGFTLGQPGALQGPGESANTAVQLDGATGKITLPSGLSPAGWTAISIGCWFNPSASVGSPTYLLANATPGSSNVGLALGLNASLAGCFCTIGNGTTFATATFSQALSTGAWYHLVATWDSTTIRLFLNGEQMTTATLSGSVGTSGTALAIGYNPVSAAGYFNGLVNELDITNPTLANATNLLDITDIVARYNAALSGIGTTQTDSFTSNTSASYIQTFGTGGSAAAVTWDTTDSRLVLVGGSKAQVLYSNLWAYDTDLLADFYQSENGGLIWGWQDASNYYELIIKDSGASSGANTMTLNKVVAGSSTQLATASIAFTAQTHRRFHLTMLSATIQVAIDGVATLAYTDTSPLPAGLAGLRNDTGTSYCYLLQITPQPVDLSLGFLCTKQSLVTSDPTATPQITDHQSLASDKTFGVGTVATVDNRQTMVSDNISNLVTQSNYWWRINDGSGVEFQPRDASDSPWILQPTDILTGSLPTVEYSADMYRNRQVLTGVFDTAQFTETRPGDGQTRSWSLSNPVVSPPSIWLNNNPVSVGINGTDTGKQYYYQPNNNTITQDNSQVILTETDLLKITYTGSYAIDFAIDNTGQIANTLSQASMAAIDGTTGVTEAVEDVSQQNMDREAATTYANQLLSRYGQIARTITFQTLHTGLQCGQSLPIFLPQYNIFDSVFLIVQVDTSVRTLATGDIQYVFTCVASEAAALSSWTKMFSRVMRGVTGTKVHVKA